MDSVELGDNKDMDEVLKRMETEEDDTSKKRKKSSTKKKEYKDLDEIKTKIPLSQKDEEENDDERFEIIKKICSYAQNEIIGPQLYDRCGYKHDATKLHNMNKKTLKSILKNIEFSLSLVKTGRYAGALLKLGSISIEYTAVNVLGVKNMKNYSNNVMNDENVKEILEIMMLQRNAFMKLPIEAQLGIALASCAYRTVAGNRAESTVETPIENTIVKETVERNVETPIKESVAPTVKEENRN